MFRQCILGHGFKAKEAEKTYPSEPPYPPLQGGRMLAATHSLIPPL